MSRVGDAYAPVVAAVLAAGPALATVSPPPAVAVRPDPAAGEGQGPSADVCRLAPHRVELRGTTRAPSAAGWMDLRFGASPFGVAVTEDGRYEYRLTVRATSVPPTAGGELVAWAATPDLDRHVKLGALGEDRAVEGRVSWNKFLVFVTAEPSADGERWRGPILMTGSSPSGDMHTMAGHGIFQQHGIGC